MFDDLLSDPLPREALILYQRENKLVRVIRLPRDAVLSRLRGSDAAAVAASSVPFLAVKVFHAQISGQGSPEYASFLREVAVLSRQPPRDCSSSSSSNSSSRLPRLLAASDPASKNSGCCWIVTEYIRGVPLQKLFVSGEFKTKLNRCLVASVIAQTAIVLSTELHQQRQTVTRDLKLPNLLLDPLNGQVHLVDFGCSAPRRSTKPEDVLPTGTKHIRAPEMYRPQGGSDEGAAGGGSAVAFNAAHECVDFFALGCALVELLTGAPAFGSFSSNEETELRDAHVAVNAVLAANGTGATARRLAQLQAADAAAADLVGQLLCADASQRLTSLDGILGHPFFLLAAKQHVAGGEYGDDNGEEGAAPPPPVDVRAATARAWTLQQWSALALDVIRSYENVQDELELQLAGM